MKKLTEDGYYDTEDKAVLSVDGEDFKVEDLDIGHPPSKRAEIHYEEPEEEEKPRRIFGKRNPENVMPREERKEAIKRWNNNPIAKDNDLVCVERNKMWIYLGAIICFFILGGVAFYLLHDDIARFVDKDFATNVIAEGDDINITNEYAFSPNINNDHTIINENNITIQLPSFTGENSTDEVVNSISNKVIEGIRPIIEEIVSNATNQTT